MTETISREKHFGLEREVEHKGDCHWSKLDPQSLRGQAPGWAHLKRQIRLPNCLASNESITPKSCSLNTLSKHRNSFSLARTRIRRDPSALRSRFFANILTKPVPHTQLCGLSRRKIKRASRLGLYRKWNTWNLFHLYRPPTTQKHRCRFPLKSCDETTRGSSEKLTNTVVIHAGRNWHN